GVRDDIERWIEDEHGYGLPSQAVRLLAQTIQQTLVVDVNNSVALDRVVREHVIVSSCSVDLYEDVKQAKDLIDRVQRFIVNTPARRDAFTRYHAALLDHHFYIPTRQD